MIFSLVQLTPRSPISSSSNWTCSVFEGDVNRSILRLNTLREKPLWRAKLNSQSISHLNCRHRESVKHTTLHTTCKLMLHIFLCSKSSELCEYQCKGSLSSLFWPACTHRHHGEIQNCKHKRKSRCMHLSPNYSALFSIKHWTTIVAMPQL